MSSSTPLTWRAVQSGTRAWRMTRMSPQHRLRPRHLPTSATAWLFKRAICCRSARLSGSAAAEPPPVCEMCRMNASLSAAAAAAAASSFAAESASLLFVAVTASPSLLLSLNGSGWFLSACLPSTSSLVCSNPGTPIRAQSTSLEKRCAGRHFSAKLPNTATDTLCQPLAASCSIRSMSRTAWWRARSSTGVQHTYR